RDEDIANARLVFANGCVANLNASRVSLKKVREIRVFQPSAYLSLDFMNQTGHLLRKSGMALDKQDIPIEKAEPLLVEIGAFVDCVRERVEPKVGAAFGKTALEVAIQIADQIQANIRTFSS
ncbi:MAG TPA: gfo/Idh/MocA family oxidoreductase, partial [Opitutales bacterium]|nr:gfo/Idh/MocA family oxidoreductase [Opitutales bacterium]